MYSLLTPCYRTQYYTSVTRYQTCIHPLYSFTLFAICYWESHCMHTEVLFNLARPVNAEPRAEPLADIVHFFGDSVVPQPAPSEKTLAQCSYNLGRNGVKGT
jgi:hypothetical protein